MYRSCRPCSRAVARIAAAADAQKLSLLADRRIVRAIDHRFALSNPALVSAPSKKCSPATREPCAEGGLQVIPKGTLAGSYDAFLNSFSRTTRSCSS